MKGTGGVRKVRFAPPSWNKGKSGATRVCYVVFNKAAVVYLLSIFSKNEKSNLTAAESAHMKRWVRHLEWQLTEDR